MVNCALQFVLLLVILSQCDGVKVDRYVGVKGSLEPLERFPPSTKTYEDCAEHCKQLHTPFQCNSFYWEEETSKCMTFNGLISAKLPPLDTDPDLMTVFAHINPSSGAINKIAPSSDGSLLSLETITVATIEECAISCCDMQAPLECNSFSYTKNAINVECELLHGVVSGVHEEDENQQAGTETGYVVLSDRYAGPQMGMTPIPAGPPPDPIPYDRYPHRAGYGLGQVASVTSSSFANCSTSCANNPLCESFQYNPKYGFCNLYRGGYVVGAKPPSYDIAIYAAYDRMLGKAKVIQFGEARPAAIETINNINETICASACYEALDCLMFRHNDYGTFASCNLYSGKFLSTTFGDEAETQPHTFGIIQGRDWDFETADAENVGASCPEPAITETMHDSAADLTQIHDNPNSGQFIPQNDYNSCMEKLASDESFLAESGDCIQPVLFQATLEDSAEVCGIEGHLATHLTKKDMLVLKSIAASKLELFRLMLGLTKVCTTYTECTTKSGMKWSIADASEPAREDNIPTFTAEGLLPDPTTNQNYFALQVAKDYLGNIETRAKLVAANKKSNVLCQYDAETRLLTPYRYDVSIETSVAVPYSTMAAAIRTSCAIKCHQDVMCHSFIYNIVANSCEFYSVRVSLLDPDADFIDSPGNIVYAKAALKKTA